MPCRCKCLKICDRLQAKSHSIAVLLLGRDILLRRLDACSCLSCGVWALSRETSCPSAAGSFSRSLVKSCASC